jgi:photosystem II stability/assembly factor-like uncharacterized protein
MSTQRFFHLLKLQFLCAFVLANIALPVRSSSPQPAPPRDTAKKHSERENAFYETRAFVSGKAVPLDIYDRAMDQWRKLPRAVALGEALTGSLHGVVWTPMGPSPVQQGTSQVNGRVSAIAINPNNANLVYQGSSGGGVWKTLNGGSTWTPLTDQQSSLGTGEPSAIGIDPSNTNTVYAGTSGRFVLNISKGILKSTDGGGSWIVLGSGFPSGNTGNAQTLFSGQNINVIIVDPANSNILYLGASNGLFRSTDGGRNWTIGTNGVGDARSLVLDKTSPTANRILYGGIDSSGVRRSTNGGQTWAQILDATTPAVAALLPPNSRLGQTLVDLAPPTSPPNPAGIQVLYASMEGACTMSGCGVPDPVGFFRSTDQGATWNAQTATGMPTNTQGGYSFSFSVDPASPGDGANDIVYFGAVGYAKSTDSGSNFAAIGGGMHVDFHSNWVFAPQPSPSPSIVFIGNDGGIWKSTDGGATWSGTGAPAPTINEGGLQTTLFYNMDVRKDATASVTEGSLQDNGTVRTAGSLTWTDTKGGDGWDFAFDTVNPSQAFHSGGFYQNPSCTRVFKSNDSGATWPTAISDGNIPAGELDCAIYAGIQVHAVNVDPSNAGFMYVSGNSSLFQTTDGGTTFRNLNNFGNRVGEVSVARANANNVVVGVRSQVWVSTNALATTGVTFTNITRNLPGRDVTRVAFDPNDPTVIYAVISGFGTTLQPRNVFRTTIGGTTWTDISAPVNAPVNAIALDSATSPTTIYIGNDFGVMRSVDDGASWTVLDDIHLPNVPVTDLAINEAAGVLRAASFGRGVFDFAQASGPVIAVNAQNGLQFGNACAGTPQYLTITVFNVGTSDLVVNSVQRLMGSTDFSVLPNPPTPITISPNSHVDFTVQYNPATPGTQQATIRITSNDPGSPVVDLTATGTQVTPDIRVTGSTTFGDVCPGTLAERTVSVCNVGACNLHVTSASVDCPDFTLVNNPFPATVSPDSCLNLVIRFTPTSPGPKSCTLTITSDDPDTPVITLTLTANTPAPSIDVPLDLTFPPTVIQNIGPCHSADPFPISNTGSCNLTITNITIGGTNAGDYSLAGLPSFPIILEPGHIVGEGALRVVFSPTVVARERRGTVEVTYESNPISHSTTTITRMLCGEGVQTGARVLVTAAGVPLPSVNKIQLQRLTVNKDADVVHNAPLQTVTPTLPCTPFQFHREYGTVSNPIQLLTGSYQVTVQATVNGHKRTQSAAFELGTCDFNPNVVVNFP